MQASIAGTTLFILLAIAGHSAIAEEADVSYIDRELDFLMSIWPGDYDNQEQISLDSNAAAGQILGQGRFHAVITPIEVTNIGAHAVYVEVSMEGDLTELYQQRIYVLEPDKATPAIRMKPYALKKPTNYKGAGWDAESLSKLNSKDLIKLHGCDLLLHRDDDSFYGVNNPETCVSHEQDGFLSRSIRIARNKFSFNDQLTSGENGKIISSTVKPRVLRRARWFACMIDVPKNTPGKSDYTQHYMRIHDQGGTYPFVHPDGRPMTLLMRNTWSYGMQRETFFIGVLEGDVNGKTLVYSWGMPGADRIGVNPGFVRIQCDLDKPGVLELQQGLRPDS